MRVRSRQGTKRRCPSRLFFFSFLTNPFWTRVTGTGRPGKSWLHNFPLNIPSNNWNKPSSTRRRDEPLRYRILIAAACISDDKLSSDRPEPQQDTRFEQGSNHFFNDAEGGDTSESIFGPVGDCDESHVMDATPHELNSTVEVNRYASQGKAESSPLSGQSPEEAFSTLLNGSLDSSHDMDVAGDDSDEPFRDGNSTDSVFLVATPRGSLEKYRLYSGGASPKIVAIGRWELTG